MAQRVNVVHLRSGVHADRHGSTTTQREVRGLGEGVVHGDGARSVRASVTTGSDTRQSGKHVTGIRRGGDVLAGARRVESTNWTHGAAGGRVGHHVQVILRREVTSKGAGA